MSQLSPFVRAFRALASSLADVATDCGDERNGLLLARFSMGLSRAATDLEQQIANDLARINAPSEVTFDPKGKA